MDISLAFVTAFIISLAIGGPLIALLRRVGARQTVSADAPARHAEKQGTPTMGGLIILSGLTVPVVLDVVVHPSHAPVLALLGLTLAFGFIGFVDDYLIATRGKNLGLKARQKFGMQVLFSVLFVVWLKMTAAAGVTTVVRVGSYFDLGIGYYMLGVLLVVGMSNAVNFMDGLDGLAGGVSTMVALALAATVFAVTGNIAMALFGGAVAGACAGFLWFNCHPAQVFMGDTGSLALGAGLAGLAMMGKVEVPFQFYSVIPWAALFSVIVQVTVFKYRTRKYGIEYARTHRVFRRTPIHHHFEELGWKETRIVQRFWLVTAAAVAVTLVAIAGH